MIYKKAVIKIGFENWYKKFHLNRSGTFQPSLLKDGELVKIEHDNGNGTSHINNGSFGLFATPNEYLEFIE